MRLSSAERASVFGMKKPSTTLARPAKGAFSPRRRASNSLIRVWNPFLTSETCLASSSSLTSSQVAEVTRISVIREVNSRYFSARLSRSSTSGIRLSLRSVSFTDQPPKMFDDVAHVLDFLARAGFGHALGLDPAGICALAQGEFARRRLQQPVEVVSHLAPSRSRRTIAARRGRS